MVTQSLYLSCLLSFMPCFTGQCVVPETHVYRASFDLGSGMFKMAVAEVDPTTNKIIKILGEKHIDMAIADDFKKHGTITAECEAQARKVLQELVTAAKELTPCDIKMKGVATAIFRKTGERGAQVLASLNKIAGDQNFIKVISAKTEGLAGLRTAQITALEKNPNRPKPLIAWDAGNSSFQITYETQRGVEVYEGPIGNADAKSTFINEVLGMPGYDREQMVYQPVSREQMEQLIALLQAKIPEPSDALKQVLKAEKNNVVTFGDPQSLFADMGALLGKNTYTKTEVIEFLNQLVNRVDVSDLMAKYPINIAYIVPMSAFLYAIMDKLGIDSIENYYAVGSTRGLLVTPELWD